MTSIERVGVIGAGNIAASHLEALRRIAGLHVLGVLDIKGDVAKKLAERFGLTRYFTDRDQFYAELKPQIVHVLTPPHTHEELVLDALKRRVHVLVEKPPSFTVSGCNLLGECESAEATVGVSENLAFSPLVQRARRLIGEDALGEIVHVDGFFSFDARPVAADLGNWTWVRCLPGGILEDLLPHPLTVVRTLLDECPSLRSWHVFRTGRVPFDLDDELRIWMTGTRSITVNLGLSLSGLPEFIVRVHGTRATLRLNLRDMFLDVSTLRPGPRGFAIGARVVGSAARSVTQTVRHAVSTFILRAPRYDSPFHLIRAHYAALSTGREVPAPLTRAKQVIHIARTIWPMPSEAAVHTRLACTGFRPDT